MKKEYSTLSVITKDIWKEFENITHSKLKIYSASWIHNEELIVVKRLNNKVLKRRFFI